MLTLIPNLAHQPHVTPAAEQASWMVVVAAESLADKQADRAERGRYSEAARRMRFALRQRWFDPQSLLEASPTFTDLNGQKHALVEAISRFHDDPEAGVRAAEMCFLAFEWRPAA
jgi:hypothetical protein